MLRHLLILPLCLWLTAASAVNLDSLWGVWNDSSQADTSRLRAIDIIILKKYLYKLPDSVIYYGQLQFNFAESKVEKKWMARAKNTQGASLLLQSKYKESLTYFEKSLKIREDIGDKKGIKGPLNNIGLIYQRIGNHKKALKYLKKSLKIANELGYKGPNTLNNIGIIYFKLKNYDKALYYYQESMKYKEDAGDKNVIANGVFNIALVKTEQGKHKESYNDFKTAINLFQETGNNRGIASCLNNIGYLYFKQSKYNEALNYYKRGLVFDKKTDDKIGIAGTLYFTGLVYKSQKKLKEAIHYFTTAINIVIEIGALDKINVYSQTLYETYKEIGNISKSLEMHELYLLTKDSLDKMDVDKEIYRFEVEKEYELKNQADSIQYQHDITIQKKPVQKNRSFKKKYKCVIPCTVGLASSASSLFLPSTDCWLPAGKKRS